MNVASGKRWAHTWGSTDPEKKRKPRFAAVSRTQHLLHLLDNGALPCPQHLEQRTQWVREQAHSN